MAVGNAGYGDAIKGATTAGNASKAASLTKMSNIATTAGKVNKYAPLIQGAASALGATGKQQPLNLGPVQEGVRAATPFVSPSMMRSYGQLGGQMRSTGGPANQSGYSNIDGASPTPFFADGGGEGPIMFRQQPLTQEAAFNYLSRYGINT
jgi:hypothetical protein